MQADHDPEGKINCADRLRCLQGQLSESRDLDTVRRTGDLVRLYGGVRASPDSDAPSRAALDGVVPDHRVDPGALHPDRPSHELVPEDRR